MSRPIRVSQLAYSELCSIIVSIEELFEDLRNDRQLVYAPDYSLFSPIAWPDRTSGNLTTDKPVSDNLDYIGANLWPGFEQVAERAKFSLVMLPPTFLELQKSLLDLASAYDSVAQSNALSEDLFRQVELFSDGKTDRMPTRAISMADSLSVKISSLPGDANINGLNYIIDLFRSGKMKGVSDYLAGSDLLRIKSRAQSMSSILLKDLNDVRNKRKNEEDDDFQFRNFADATNIGFSYAVSGDSSVPFIPYLGPAPRAIMDNNYVDLQDKAMRNPLSPFLIVSAMLNSSGNRWESGLDYLEVLLDKIGPLVKYLANTDRLEALPQHKHDAILEFYNKDMVNLFDHRERREELKRREMSRASSLLSSKDGFRDRFSAAAGEIRNKGEEMVTAQPGMLADELVDFYNMRKSPKARAILTKYGIS